MTKSQLTFLDVAGERIACPFRDVVRKHTEREREALKASGLDCGGFVDPAVTYDSPSLGCRAFIDGQTRAELHLEAGIPLKITHLEGVTDEVAEAMARGLNFGRRHLTLKEQQEARVPRLDRVKDMRKIGMSLRAIAAKEGISKSQVEADLKEAEVSTPGQVAGLDGKTYSIPEMLKDLRKFVETSPNPAPAIVDMPDPEYKPEPFPRTHPHADLLTRLDALTRSIEQIRHECPPLAKAFGRTNAPWLLKGLRTIILSVREAA